MTTSNGVAGEDWTPAEVRETVQSYFRMLRMQELGQSFVKSRLLQELGEKLPARNRSAIEYKFRNISSVLHSFGVPAVSGYKPLSNFQGLLVDAVADALEIDRQLDDATLRSVETPAEKPLLESMEDFVVDIPVPKHRVNEAQNGFIQRKPIRRDYLEREAKNRSLGHAGELLVMEYEARRLFAEGAKKLADRIEHVSSRRGDGLGHDILSFDADGRERFIEVKTTAYDAETPFFITPNEVEFSAENPFQFHLYRLFSFRKRPRMFTQVGPVEANFHLETSNYRATLRGS
ncbi:hypothetical protein CSC70_03285 [Pseudoxanthomonas kalamensis DSM 18571]|uniref:DUF3883 domain-containing protein n=1 Tax=Pseudoxanthomonas kalamensis TaxID=289483 RepID=UPI0013914BD5|nr:DUF3883 domain-containing protein [Pseudoxanthomonas kalamensis]KAF1712550.1 hypothetical protein CSC70_03285 [Pseudoxanthomonas kalamensis DSM 18571]